ncbi:DUF3090 domain-containing protein [Nocardioides sp. BP30]|uniref:DUF3090 domain-containing protein n=1 Tax=Nocardioides sp. BP30 TaxID=3036374 RepID=UPI0024682A5A|nr:DUF3090 domain-containing protein [Nocardioides sp. BP30]WGL50819.1 DUF3090 domain-containing protein [Nocardioides sp. BP30]
MPVVHAFDPPERFVVGTVGEPGARTFFLQARVGTLVVSVALEKQQVAVLAERVDELLDDVMREASSVVPAVAPYGLDDNGPLEQPIAEEFRVGTMTLSWDPDDERVVIEIFPVEETLTGGEETAVPEESDDAEPDEMMLVRLEPAHARAFVKRAALVVDAGRPSCPFCGGPIDPNGHLCVRANGFKRRIADDQ